MKTITNTKKINKNDIMTLAKVFESIEELAKEKMKKDGINLDNFQDHVEYYIYEIIKDIRQINDR